MDLVGFYRTDSLGSWPELQNVSLLLSDSIPLHRQVTYKIDLTYNH